MPISYTFQNFLKRYPESNDIEINGPNDYYNAIIIILVQWLNDKYSKKHNKYYIYIVWYIYYAISNNLIKPGMSKDEITNVFKDLYNEYPDLISLSFDNNKEHLINIFNLSDISYKILNENDIPAFSDKNNDIYNIINIDLSSNVYMEVVDEEELTYTTNDGITITINVSYDTDYGSLDKISIKDTKRNKISTYDIKGILGKSNAIVLNLGDEYQNMCMKIGDIKFEKGVVDYIIKHENDYVKIYFYANNINFGKKLNIYNKVYETFDILIMEKTGDTLSSIIEKHQDKILSIDTYKYLMCTLLRISTDLLNAGFCYSDLKPDNVGIVYDSNNFYFKLIDLDSISRYDKLNTLTTMGRMKQHMNLNTVQYMNAFFTVIATMFDNNFKKICSTKISEQEINSLFSDMPEMKSMCLNYKYTILSAIKNVLDIFTSKTNLSLKKSMYYTNEITDSLITNSIYNTSYVSDFDYQYLLFFVIVSIYMYNLIFYKNINDQTQIINQLYNIIDIYNKHHARNIVKKIMVSKPLNMNMSYGEVAIKIMESYNHNRCNEDCKNIINDMKNIYNL